MRKERKKTPLLVLRKSKNNNNWKIDINKRNIKSLN